MVGFFLSAVVEIPAGIISMILLMVCGRRTVTIISLTGQAISLGLTIFTPRGFIFEIFRVSNFLTFGFRVSFSGFFKIF